MTSALDCYHELLSWVTSGYTAPDWQWSVKNAELVAIVVVNKAIACCRELPGWGYVRVKWHQIEIGQ
jgi:hypothetical protein